MKLQQTTSLNYVKLLLDIWGLFFLFIIKRNNEYIIFQWLIINRLIQGDKQQVHSATSVQYNLQSLFLSTVLRNSIFISIPLKILCKWQTGGERTNWSDYTAHLVQQKRAHAPTWKKWKIDGLLTECYAPSVCPLHKWKTDCINASDQHYAPFLCSDYFVLT